MDTFLHEPKSVSLANYRGRVDSNWPLCSCPWKRHCRRRRSCPCALRLSLMWWNPHGEMMCSAEGWQSREGLPMSEACWTTYTFRTAAPVRQRRIRINPPCSHYLSNFLFSFFFPFSPSRSASRRARQQQMFVPVHFSCLISHIWSRRAVCRSVKSLSHCGLSGPVVFNMVWWWRAGVGEKKKKKADSN